MGTGGAGAAFLFELHKGCWDYAGDRVGAREGDECAGYFSHDADGTAAVDEVDAVLMEGFTEGFCGGEIGG